MNENEALDESTMVSVGEACTELAMHWVDFFRQTRCGVTYLVDRDSNQIIATVDNDDMVHSADVMKFLGY